MRLRTGDKEGEWWLGMGGVCGRAGMRLGGRSRLLEKMLELELEFVSGFELVLE